VSAQTRHCQRGTALVVSLIMLTLITLLVVTAMNLASTGFRSVSNTQFRDEAIGAANFAIQQVIGSAFTVEPAAEPVNVDLDDDGTVDYIVNVAEPTCIFADVANVADPSSIALPVAMTAASTWNTVWDLDASVAPADNTAEAAVRVRAGVRVLLTQAERDTVCP
jgi:hypothetical protein